jgi:hypothetical protein
LTDGILLQQARRLAFGSKEPTEHLRAARVKRLSRSAPLSLFIEALEQDGCVIIKDFTDEATLKQADKEVRPWLGVEDEGAVVGGRSSLL